MTGPTAAESPHHASPPTTALLMHGNATWSCGPSWCAWCIARIAPVGPWNSQRWIAYSAKLNTNRPTPTEATGIAQPSASRTPSQPAVRAHARSIAYEAT